MSDKPYHHLKEDYDGVCKESRRQDAIIAKLREQLQSAQDQIVFLHHLFQPTGSGKAEIAKIEALLRETI